MANRLSFLWLFGFFITFFIYEGSAYQVGNNPFHRAEKLDPDGKYLLEWEVNWNTKRIAFNVTVETRNWVGFGLSNDGTGSGADMVIGGVGPNGQPYFSDRHIVIGSEISVLDRQQDYTLHSAKERAHTVLSFSRAFDTCDPEDYAITLNKVTLLWAYGRDDNEDGYNPENRGVYHTHLLDPDYSPEIIRERPNANPILITHNRNEHVPPNTKVWSVHKSKTLSPNNHTEYICQIHKAPRLRKKHHWIGFDIHFPDEESRLRIHHMVFYKCISPPGLTDKQLFQSHVNNPGEPCYIFRTASTDLTFPVQFCTEMYFEWAIGAKTFFMPNHIGVPFGQSPDEYYMIQMHYDNPEQQAGIHVEARLDFFYTSQLRPNDGGVLGFIHDVPGLPESVIVPPHSQQHRIFSHCAPECTQRMYPDGIRIAALTLHSHNAGVGIRMRHFRGDRELPWILFDDNYDNWVQPFRHLRNEVRVLPGDQLTIECHFTTNETSAVGGFSTRQEMCNAFLLYYNHVEGHSWCQSGINSRDDRQRLLGIRNTTWIQENLLEWVVRTPRSLSGLTLPEVSDRYIDWTPERRDELQRFHEVHPQVGRCVREPYTRTLAEIAALPRNPIAVPSPGPLNTRDEFIGPVSYPFRATPYVPPGSSCRNNKIGRGSYFFYLLNNNS